MIDEKLMRQELPPVSPPAASSDAGVVWDPEGQGTASAMLRGGLGGGSCC